MKNFLTGLAAFLVTGALAHFVVLERPARKIMTKVRDRMMESGLTEKCLANEPPYEPGNAKPWCAPRQT